MWLIDFPGAGKGRFGGHKFEKVERDGENKLDPGLSFSKSLPHALSILRRVPRANFHTLQWPETLNVYCTISYIFHHSPNVVRTCWEVQTVLRSMSATKIEFYAQLL